MLVALAGNKNNLRMTRTWFRYTTFDIVERLDGAVGKFVCDIQIKNGRILPGSNNGNQVILLGLRKRGRRTKEWNFSRPVFRRKNTSIPRSWVEMTE